MNLDSLVKLHEVVMWLDSVPHTDPDAKNISRQYARELRKIMMHEYMKVINGQFEVHKSSGGVESQREAAD